MGVFKRKDRPNTWYATWMEGGKQQKIGFRSEEEANACLQMKLAALKCNAVPVLSGAAKRAVDLKRCGDNCSLERRVAWKIHEACVATGVLDCIVLNDGTRADLAVKLCSAKLYVGLQLKTTSGPLSKRQPNTWAFNHMHGYEGMLVVCWRGDQDDGWLCRGDDSRPEMWTFTLPKYKIAPMAIDPLVSSIVQLLSASHGLDENSEEFLRWNVGTPSGVTEMRMFSTYCQWTSTQCRFPADQNGTYDLIEDSTNRLQFKHSRARWFKSTSTGFDVHLTKKAGTVAGKKTVRPYDIGDFDALVVGHMDYERKLMFTWKIPSSKLERFFDTDAHSGIGSLVVHPPDAVRREYQLGPAPRKVANILWSSAYFVGVLPIAEMSDDARRACASVIGK